MAQGDTPITIIGNAVADPQLRFTSSGVPVANVRVASTPRVFNRQSNQWVDGESLFLTCNCWREMANNVMESVTKGTRVVVTGILKADKFVDKKTHEHRTEMKIEVDDIGPSLKFATAQVNRNQRAGGGGVGNGHTPAGRGDRRASSSTGTSSTSDDPWNSTAGGTGDFPEEPPF